MNNENLKVTINDGYINLGKADEGQKQFQDFIKNSNARGEPHPQKKNEDQNLEESNKFKISKIRARNLSPIKEPTASNRKKYQVLKRKHLSYMAKNNKYHGKMCGIPDKKCCTSQSEFSLVNKYAKINGKNPLSPFIQNNIDQSLKADINEGPCIDKKDNKYTMTTNMGTKNHNKSKEENEEHFKSSHQSLNETYYFGNQQFRDPRLLAKYSILNMPWRRTWTMPVFSPRSGNVLGNGDCKAAMQDVIDRQTYLYDDGTEVDSILLENKNKIFRKKKSFQYKVNPFLLIGGSLFGILLVAILVWLTYGTDIFKLFFKPKEIDNDNLLKCYVKYIGGRIIYIISSIITNIAKILTIPTNQVFSNQENNDRFPFRV